MANSKTGVCKHHQNSSLVSKTRWRKLWSLQKYSGNFFTKENWGKIRVKITDFSTVSKKVLRGIQRYQMRHFGGSYLYPWLQKCPDILHKYQFINFICGIGNIWKLQIFAEFSTRASDLDKKNFVENLGRYHVSIRIFSEWGPHRWCYGGGSFSRFWPPPSQEKNKMSELCLKTCDFNY